MPSDMPYFAQIHSANFFDHDPDKDKIWEKSYSLRLKNGSWLELPLVPLPGAKEAIALLMSNQCDFCITEQISTLMACEVSSFQADCVAAIPTMGLEYAPRIAQKLGKTNFVAMGFSQKFWYSNEISEPIISSTCPDQLKRIFLDPHLLNRIQGKRVVLVDDVINTGASVLAAIKLLKRVGAKEVRTVVALSEGHSWEKALSDPSIKNSNQLYSTGHIPLFKQKGKGWQAIAETL